MSRLTDEPKRQPHGLSQSRRTINRYNLTHYTGRYFEANREVKAIRELNPESNVNSPYAAESIWRAEVEKAVRKRQEMLDKVEYWNEVVNGWMGE